MTSTRDTRSLIFDELHFSNLHRISISTKFSYANYVEMALPIMLKSKDRIALIDGLTGERITYGELVQLVVNTASSLMRLGVQRDEVVAVCSENRMEFLITTFAAWCCGATVTFLNSAYGKNELVHTMKISKPKYVFLSPQTYKTFYDTMVNTNIVDKFFIYGNVIDDTRLSKFKELTKTHVDVGSFKPVTDFTNGLAQTALILYSSGTTGLPKGAKLTHLNLITSASQPRIFSRDLICLTVIPWSNTMGIICTMDELTHHGTVLYLARFQLEQYLSCIQKYKAGMLVLVPSLMVMLAKSSVVNKNYDVSSIEIIYCSGATLDVTVTTEIKQRFKGLTHVLQGYGMTETSGVLTEETETAFKLGSVGKVVPGNIVKIADIETGRTLGPNQAGEVRFKGLTLFAGYIGKNLKDELDEEGFFKTGDICYYDEDGYFYFVDRIKELIKYKAGQVSPSELEAILLQHPGVKDVGVTGKPDPLVGELPTAFVVKKSEVTGKELVDMVAAKVSSWKQLRGGVYFVEDIPKTPSGKILRRILRDYLKKPSSKL